MAKLTQQERAAIAEKRLLAVIGRHGIATMRTIEQKIADAGPTNQRIDPHIITKVRNALIARGDLVEQRAVGVPWFRLSVVIGRGMARRRWSVTASWP